MCMQYYSVYYYPIIFVYVHALSMYYFYLPIALSGFRHLAKSQHPPWCIRDFEVERGGGAINCKYTIFLAKQRSPAWLVLTTAKTLQMLPILKVFT